MRREMRRGEGGFWTGGGVSFVGGSIGEATFPKEVDEAVVPELLR